MAGMLFELEVQPDGGDLYRVVADQRDVAAWEVEPFGGPVARYPERVFTFARFLAWHHARRTGATKLDFAKWGNTIIWVDLREDDETESADPGVSAPSADIS